MSTVDDTQLLADAVGLSEVQLNVVDSLLDCMRRWGLAKTNMDDVARTAGISRATLYRHFPGGKQEILDLAARAEARHLAQQLTDQIRQVTSLEECLVTTVHSASCLLAELEVLAFMRDAEPVALQQVLSFEHLDGIFAAFAPILQPELERVLSTDAASEVTIWLARIVVSYLQVPSPTLDLRNRDDVATLVAAVVLPGIDDADVVITVP